MSLTNKETGEPPRSADQLMRRAKEKEKEYEEILLKKSVAEALQTLEDETSELKKRFERLMNEYEALLQREEKSRNEWQEKQSSGLNTLRSVNQQLQFSINQEVRGLADNLKESALRKVEDVTKAANTQISKTVGEFTKTAENAKKTVQEYAAKIQKEMQSAHSDISGQYRKAFGIGVGWKILMGAGSVALIAMLVLHYIVGVV